MSTQLGSPADRHFIPKLPKQPHSGYQGDGQYSPPRKKGAAQQQRDRDRAAAHRAKKQESSESVAASAAEESNSPTPPPTTLPAASASDPLGLPVAESQATGPGQETLATQPAASAVAPLNHFLTPSVPPPPLVPAVSLKAVEDEVLQEESEVKVCATGIFENCPDPTLEEDYFVSMKKFILSETHLQSNISNVSIVPISSRLSSPRLYIHTVSVEMTVKTANLWEPPRAYVYKHLGKSDWLRGNKTRITLVKIQ